MNQNIGTVDRVIRVVAAVLIALLLLLGYIPGVVGTVFGAVAVIFFATSLVGFCPLYAPFKISTKKQASTQAR